MLSKEEKKKREQEFDAMFGNTSKVSNNDIQAREQEFDSMFGNQDNFLSAENGFISDQTEIKRQINDILNRPKQEVEQIPSNNENIEEESVVPTARGGNKISGLPTPIGVSNRKTVEDTQTKTTLADRQEQLKTIKSNYDDTIQNSNGLKELPKTAGMTARENVKKGNNILPSNENTITVNSEELNYNIIQDIPGLLQNTWRGGVNGARRSLNYFINANEVISPVYKEQTLNQFFAGPGVSDLEKWQYESKNDIFTPEAVRETIPDVETNKHKEKIQNDINQTNLEIQETASKMSNEVTRKLALDIMPSIGQMSVGTILSYVNPVLGLGYFTTSAAGSYYEDGIQRGMTQDDALLYGTIMGAMEGATEQIGLNQFKKAGQGIKALITGTGKEGLKSLAKQETINSLKDVLKNYGIGMADNFIQEAVIDPIQEATADLVDDKGDWDGILQKMLSDGIDGAIVAAIVGGADVGINSCISIVDKVTNGNTITQDEYRQAIQDIQQDGRISIEQEIQDSISNLAQNFDKNTYYEAITDNNGNLNVIPVKGKPIENINQNINISPVIIKDNNTGYFNVIDGNSGLVLDTHPYTTEQEAEIGYNRLIDNVDNATIKNINNRVTQNVMEIQNKIVEANQEIENYARNLNENAQIQVKNNQITNDTTLQERMNITNSSDNNIRSERIVNNNSTESLKQEQLNIIQQTNPMQDDYHTGIRTINDIKTFQEAYDIAKQEATDGGWTEYASYPDITNEMIDNALKSGKITVYSSNTIKNGIFVTPSYEQALEYAGNDSSKVKSKVVNVDDVAWINLDEGQYAKIKKVDVARLQLPGSINSINNNIQQNPQNVNNKKVAKSPKIQYNENGIQLGKREYANVTSLINTNKPNDTGIQFINSSDYFYIYENNSFDNNNIIAKIEINGNEDLIKVVRRRIENGTFEGAGTLIRAAKEYRRNGRRFNNRNNVISQGERTDGRTTRLHNRDVGQNEVTEQGRNNQESNRNKSRIDNKSNIENSNTSSFSLKNNTSKDDGVRYDKIKRTSINKNTNTERIDPAIQKELHNRIINATLNKNSRKNTFLGIVSDKVANKIKSLFGIDVTGRRHMITDYDIRHILNQHGDTKIEKARGQIAVTKADIEKIPDIINNYDSITKGTPNIDTLSKKKFNTIRYTKKYNDNITYVVEVIPSNNNQLNIKTMWKKEIKINKENNSARVSHSNKTLPYTSETKPSSSYSNDSITQNRQEVKNEPYDERKANNDREYYRQQKQNNYLSQIAPEQGATYAQQSNANKLIEDSIREIEETGAWDNSIPVTKLTDIRKEIEKYLGFGIYKGHFRQQAYGIYNKQNDSIRVKEYKDIDTILHETGHALDIGNRLNVDKNIISDELIKAVDKHGGYENDTREVRLEEGLAEVIRTYAIRPDLATSEYPKTTAILMGIREQNESFNNFIGKIQDMTYNYIHQNPENRVISNQSIGQRTDETPHTARSIKESIAKAIYDKDYVLKETVNEFAKASGKSMKDVEPSKNAYILTRLASGVQNKAISMISDGYIDLNGNKVMPGLNQLGEILDNNPQRFNDLRAYLVANRDLDYKSKKLKTGLRTNDSKSVINKFKSDKQIQAAAKVIYDTLDGVLKYATDNGLINKETADSLKESNTFYVPFQRVLENDRGNQVGRRGSVADIIRQRTGSELDIKDVLENVVTNSANIIQQVENNNVLRALYKQGEEAGIKNKVFTEIPTPMRKVGTATLATWENELQKQGVDTTNLDLEKTIDIFAPNNKIDRQNLITSFIDENGKRVYLQFASGTEDLFNSIMNLDKNANSQFLKIMRAMNMPLRYGATMANVGFAIPNMISDTAQAAIYSEAGFVPVVDNAIGVLDVLTATNKTVRNFMNKVSPEYAKRINNLYSIYQQTGASSSTRMSQYRKSAQEIMEDVYGTSSKNLGINDKFRPLKNLLDIMTYIPELSESSTRFRVFERNYENYKNKGGTEIDARIKAAIESRDATQDFGRTGTITREINQLIPFSAARVGSVYTFSEKISANPKVVGAKIALLSVIAMAIKALGYDDDEIEELNQRKKDDNFVLKIGDTVVTIKKPQGILRSIINLTEYIQDLVTGHIEEGKETERLGEWLNNAIMDNMPADEITGLVPNPVAPLIENAINKDFYYNSDIVKDYDTDLPDYMQYYDYNSQLAIWLGKIFNYSPAKIDNLISGYFGGLGTTVTNIIDWISGKLGFSVEEPNMGLEDSTIGKRFVVNVNENSQSIDDVYTRQEELTKKQNGGTITEEETQELEKIKEAVSKMATLNKQIKAIKQDENMSGDEKAEQIRPLQEQKTDVARQALGKEPIYTENTEDLEALSFYPSRSTLSLDGKTLELTEEMKKEYQDIAYEQYKKYESQGIYSEDFLESLKSKCKDIAKKKLMQKYKLQLK